MICAQKPHGYRLDPDQPVVEWSEQERKKGQAWGMKTIETFHTHGTPDIDAPQH